MQISVCNAIYLILRISFFWFFNVFILGQLVFFKVHKKLLMNCVLVSSRSDLQTTPAFFDVIRIQFLYEQF
jgi:hypothetical protein